MTPGSRPRAETTEPTAAAGVARAWVDLAAAKGVGRRALLERCRLEQEALEDRDRRIPFSQLVTLIRTAKELSHEPALALHFGELVDCAEYSIVTMISRTCATVADALVQRNRYGRLLAEIDCDGPDRFVLEPSGRSVWLIDTRKNPDQIPELTESVFAVVACGARAMREAPLLQAAHFTHEEPPYRAEYERVFRVPLVFRSRRNALLLDAAWLSQRLAAAPTYVFGILSAHADGLLDDLESSKTVRGRVESLLLPILHTGDVSMQRIAGELGISRQTLYRRLRAEGTTFEGVLNALRHRLALHYLRGGKVSVNETAYLVGFSEPAAFSRAFKRWTGQRPSSVRQTAQAERGGEAIPW